jgi:PAS domain S-box-containing protein
MRRRADLQTEPADTLLRFEAGETGQALRESEARLQAAVDLVGLGLYRWTPATDALEWDARVKAMWGLPPHALIDQQVWLAGIHPDDRARVQAAVDRCLDPQADGVYDLEYRVIGSLDGAERWIATRGRMSFENRQPADFLGVAIDNTEQRRAERSLRESQARLAEILKQLPVGVGLINRDGRTVLRGGSLGHLWTDVMPSRDPAQRRRWRSYDGNGRLLEPAEYPGARALRGESVVPGLDFIHTAHDGSEMWVRVTTTPFRDAGGEIAGAVAISQNVDEEKRALHARELMISELQHRTRNILAVVRAISRQTRAASRTLDDYMAQFEDRLGALSRVQSLLSRGHDPLLTLEQLVRMELDALGAEIDGERISIAGPEVSLPSRSVQTLALALHELATNALKHGVLLFPGGRLAVNWQLGGDNGDRVAIEWRESGTGLRQREAQSLRRGYGRRLIEEGLAYQLDAETRLEFLEDGVRCFIDMPLNGGRSS